MSQCKKRCDGDDKCFSFHFNVQGKEPNCNLYKERGSTGNGSHDSLCYIKENIPEPEPEVVVEVENALFRKVKDKSYCINNLVISD